MSFLDTIKQAGGSAIHGIDNFGDDCFNGAKQIGSNVARGAEIVGSNVVKGAEVTEHVAVKSFQFQAAVSRVALEKTFDGAKQIGSTAAHLTAAGFNKVTHPGTPNPPAAQGLNFAETKSASGLAYDAKLGERYTFPDGRQWNVVDVSENSKTGFRAIALKPVDQNDRRVIVAFAGTRDAVDWKANAGQGLGLPTKQYNAAVQFADKWKEAHGNNVILTGHSLGGGLASYTSIKTGLPATAVNSAPLALNHLGLNPRAASRITQYYVPGEALSILNAKNPLDIRPGNQIAVQGKNSILDPRSPITNHSLGSVAPNIPAPEKVEIH